MGRPAKWALPHDELAKLAGVATKTLKEHAKHGAPMPRSKAEINGWLPRYHAWRDQTRRSGGAPTRQVDPEDQRWSTERKRYLALMAKITVGEKMRTLIPREHVVEFANRASLTAKNRMQAMVKKIAARLGPLIPGADGHAIVERELGAEVHEICRAFAKGMARTHEDDPARTGTGVPAELGAGGADDGEPMG